MRSKKKVIHAKRKGQRIRYTTISIPQDFSFELRRLKDIYSDVWGERVSYETILSRLLSRTGLGSVDPDVYARFVKEKEPEASLSTPQGRSASKKISTSRPDGRSEKSQAGDSDAINPNTQTSILSIKEDLTLDGRSCHLIGHNQPCCIIVIPTMVFDTVSISTIADELSSLTHEPFMIASYEVADGEEELMPWPALKISKRDGAGKHAEETLQFVDNKFVPYLKERFEESTPVVLGGDSLAGLFSIWASQKTETISAIAAVSPLVSMPKWDDHVKKSATHAKNIYISFLLSEGNDKNVYNVHVGKRIQAQHELWQSQVGEDHCSLVWQEDNHNNINIRLAEAFAWCIERISAVQS